MSASGRFADCRSARVNGPRRAKSQRSSAVLLSPVMSLIRSTPLSHDCSVNVVQVSPTNGAEYQQRIRIEALGQRLLRELPELDTRLQQDLDDGSEHGLRSTNNISRSKEPHSVDKSDHALLIAAQCDLVVGVGAQE